MVSHDLPLLDAAITTVLDLDGAKLEPYRGNYSGFLVERANGASSANANDDTRTRRSSASSTTSAGSRARPRRWPRWPALWRAGSNG